MPKSIASSKLQEWNALDRIGLVTHSMGCIWREITKDDNGIDGEIEVTVPKQDGEGFETFGGIIKVQAKSGGSYVIQNTLVNFASPVRKDDLEYWFNSNFPVLFIVYHPEDDKLYCKEIKTYIRNTPDVWQPPFRVVFDKVADEFNEGYHKDLIQLAGTSPPRISFQEREQLYSNLLRVKRLPQILKYAETEYSGAEEVSSLAGKHLPPFCVVENRLYSLVNPRNSALADFCNAERIGEIPAQSWADSQERCRDFVYLLNQLFASHAYHCGLKYDRHFKRDYFPRESDDDEETEFKKEWVNVRTDRKSSRTVVKYYEYGVDKFWRHLAANFSFKQIGNEWFLQIIPKYFFTYDGEIPFASKKVGPYTTRQKANERNIHVLNHVLFWADILSHQEPEIRLREAGNILLTIEKKPITTVVNFAIPYDPAVYEESETVTQPSFLDLLEEDED